MSVSTLIWSNGEYKLTVLLDKSNVSTIQSAAGFTLFDSFLPTSEMEPYDASPVCIVSSADDLPDDPEITPEEEPPWLPSLPKNIIDLNGPPLSKEQRTFKRAQCIERLFLDIHMATGHLPFACI